MANNGTTFLAFLTGAAIGAGFGLLYAPDSGEETRRKISENALRAQDDINKKYRETSSNLSSKANKAKSDFEKRLEDTLVNASGKADEILESLEEKLEELREKNAKFRESRSKGKTSDDPNLDTSTDNAVV